MEINSLRENRNINNIQNYLINQLDVFYPIGSLYFSINNVNPGTIIGGVWEPWGSGRVPVGVNTSDGDFGTVEKEIGNKTVNLPNHNHSYGISIPYYYGMTGGERVASGVGVYDYEKNAYAGFTKGSESEKIDTKINNSVQTSSKTVNADINKSQGKTSSAGSSNINIIQPSITCYMWKRVEADYTIKGLLEDGTVFYQQRDLSSVYNFDESAEDLVGSKNIEKCIIVSDSNKVTNLQSFFNRQEKLKYVDFSQLDVSNVTDFFNMFTACSSLKQIDLSNWNMNNAYRTTSMFYNCDSLLEVKLGEVNSSKLDDISSMFSNCDNLKNIDLSKFHTLNVTDMSNLFHGCYSLKFLDLSAFDTSNVTNMRDMFYSCENLIELDLSNFNTLNVKNMYGMFENCASLKELDISSFDFSNVTSYDNMFGNANGGTALSSDCLIYVKDQTAKDFVLNARNDLTNVQIKQ